MRCLLVLVILGMLGCQGVVGPLQYRQPKRVDDPSLPISEQEKRGRDQLALPVESYEVGPPTGMIPQGVFSR